MPCNSVSPSVGGMEVLGRFSRITPDKFVQRNLRVHGAVKENIFSAFLGQVISLVNTIAF